MAVKHISELRDICLDEPTEPFHYPSIVYPSFLRATLLASPNYPRKYPSNVTCSVQVVVPQHHLLDVTLLDFELDIKRDGVCKANICDPKQICLFQKQLINVKLIINSIYKNEKKGFN
ncbi:hypothetical protein HELRODRAFT_182497 [Helobdella robusta]|uniref:CUB domain-containing protein n=1 Tax=Helobdella robusta TaxID=6412 RepID=T1FI99_HELRO|nr:hypothetical protein HELRODRAFT_182497 [Helobdella robusta]ESN90908.1 hypothetical protein HELRODRAFT_182497 [Helobdella robusta]